MFVTDHECSAGRKIDAALLIALDAVFVKLDAA